jgi:hypothetical protein
MSWGLVLLPIRRQGTSCRDASGQAPTWRTHEDGDPAHPNHPTVLSQVQVVAKAIGIEVSSIEVRGADEIERVLERVALEGLGALMCHRTRLGR